MIARVAALAGLIVATGALAQDADDFYQPSLDLLEASLAKVQAPKVNFYSGDETPGCPALTPKCGRAAYLRAGDVVVVGTTRGGFVEADFTAGGARSTNGWLPRSALVPLPASPATLAGWRGDWVRDDEANISLKLGKRPGSIAVAGDATYGMHDPGRVKRGAVNIGELEEEGVPKGDRLDVGATDQYACRVRMRLLPPYLIVADNNKCGGMNVSFSGVYRRAATKG